MPFINVIAGLAPEIYLYAKKMDSRVTGRTGASMWAARIPVEEVW